MVVVVVVEEVGGGVGVGRRVDLQSTSVIKVIAKVGNVTGKGGRREEGGATSRGKYGSFSTGQEGRRQSKYRTRGERERERERDLRKDTKAARRVYMLRSQRDARQSREASRPCESF